MSGDDISNAMAVAIIAPLVVALIVTFIVGGIKLHSKVSVLSSKIDANQIDANNKRDNIAANLATSQTSWEKTLIAHTLDDDKRFDTLEHKLNTMENVLVECNTMVKLLVGDKIKKGG